MTSKLYERIIELCEQHNITISKLEGDCGFANATIKKWKSASTPGVDKVQAIAQYFNVTVDYLLGRTDIPSSAEEIIGDHDIISLQRARSKMSTREKERMMQLVKIGFENAFDDI